VKESPGPPPKTPEPSAKELRADLIESAERLIRAAEQDLEGSVKREVGAFFETNRAALKGGAAVWVLKAACDRYCQAPRDFPAGERLVKMFSDALSQCERAEALGPGSEDATRLKQRAAAGRKGATQEGFTENLRAAIGGQIAVAAEFAKKLDGIVSQVLGPSGTPWRPGAVATDQEARRKSFGKALSDFAQAEKDAPNAALHKLILSVKVEELMIRYNGAFEGNYGLDDANLRSALNEALRGRNREDSPMTFKVHDFLLEQLDMRAKEPRARAAEKGRDDGAVR